MSKINNKGAYPIDSGLSLDDFLLGSNADNFDKTQNYLLRGIFSTFKTSLGLSSIEYIFSDESNPELTEEDAGYFTTNGGATLAGAITTIDINKTDLSGIDISSLVDTVNGNLSSFMLTLFKPSATGQVFYFQVTNITDNVTTYQLTVDNFVGGNSLENESTYTLNFDLAGVPSTLTETDPVFLASDAAAVTALKISNWDTAFGWGDHGAAGYQAALGGTGIVKSTLGTISYVTDNSANWNTAFGWGDHGVAGYLTTESDPVFLAHPASGVTSLRLTQWDTAFNWGDHGAVGYLTSFTESDPIFTASAAFGITSLKLNEWNAAYSWGDHAAVDYIRESISADKTGGDIVFHDNIKSKFGTSGDMSIFHTGIDNIIQIDNGDLIIRDGATERITFGRTTGNITSAIGDLTLTTGSIFLNSVTANTWALRADSNDANYSGLWFTTGHDANLYLRDSLGVASKLQPDGAAGFIMNDKLTIQSNLAADTRAIDFRTSSNEDQSVRIRHEVSDGNLLSAGYALIIESQNGVPQARASLEVEGYIGSLDGMVSATRDGAVASADAYRAVMGTSSTPENYLFGGSSTGQTDALDTYLRVRSIANGDLKFQEGGNTWQVWHEGNFTPLTGAAAFTTTGWATGNIGNWTKIASVDTNAFQARSASITVVGAGHTDVDGEPYTQTIHLHVKQQAPAGSDPYLQANTYHNGKAGFDVGYVIVSNTPLPSTVDFYIQGNINYTSWFGTIDSIDSSGSWTFYNSQTIVTTPVGIVESTAKQIWHSGNDGAGSGLDADTLDGLQVAAPSAFYNAIPYTSAGGVTEIGRYLDYHRVNDATDYHFRIDALAANTLRQYNLDATNRYEVYKSSVDFIRMEANASGSALVMGGGGLTDTIIRSYSNTDFNGGDVNINNGTLFVNTQVSIDGITKWNVSAADTAHQRVDARDDGTTEARLHWYGVSDTGTTRSFKHAWYDIGNTDYLDIDINNGLLTFEYRDAAESLEVEFASGKDATVHIRADRVNNAYGEISDATLRLSQDGNIKSLQLGTVAASGNHLTATIGNDAYIKTETTGEDIWFGGGTTAVFKMDMGDGSFYFDTTMYVRNSSDRAGLVEIGSSNTAYGWYGIQIKDDTAKRWSLMGNATQYGAYDDELNEWAWLYTENAGVVIYHNGSSKFQTTSVGITVTGDGTATDWNATSDARLKDNIRPLEVEPITTPWSTWEWKEDGKTQIGMVAQELEKTHPQFVKEGDDGYKSISYTQVLIAKMAEKDKQIEQLTERMDRLEKLLTIGLN